MTVPFLLVRTRVGLRTRLVEVTCIGETFRVAAREDVRICSADDITAVLLEPFADAGHASEGNRDEAPEDADIIVIGCCDEITTPCLVATRRDGAWHDTTVDESTTRDWFDVRAEVVAALVALHVQSTALATAASATATEAAA